MHDFFMYKIILEFMIIQHKVLPKQSSQVKLKSSHLESISRDMCHMFQYFAYLKFGSSDAKGAVFIVLCKLV